MGCECHPTFYPELTEALLVSSCQLWDMKCFLQISPDSCAHLPPEFRVKWSTQKIQIQAGKMYLLVYGEKQQKSHFNKLFSSSESEIQSGEGQFQLYVYCLSPSQASSCHRGHMLLEMFILTEDPCVFQVQTVAAAFVTHSLQHNHNQGKMRDTLLQALTEWAPNKVNLPISWLIPAPAGIQGCLQIHSTREGGAEVCRWRDKPTGG